MFIAIAVILVAMWAFGFSVDIGGGLIHILLALALGALIYNMIAGRQESVA